MIQRQLATKLKSQLKKFPVVSITGPRQSGKTTLAKTIGTDFDYYNLEDINTKRFATSDPVGFINSIDKPAIIDEIQKVPDLLSQIQVKVDETGKLGQFILTGSESLLLSDKISQSLAGRVVNNTLLPLSLSELRDSKINLKMKDQILNGFYPRIYESNLTAKDFYPEYINTYVEKDIRQIANIGDLALFEKFLGLIAGRVGQLLNINSLSNDLGISFSTVEKWISILEASFIVYRLQPYFTNIGKRLVKSPKIYFYDTGILCYLLGINSQNDLTKHYSYGSIFENLIISELKKQIFNNKLTTKMYFYRDSNGNEIDLLLENMENFDLIEIKSSETYSKEFEKAFEAVKFKNFSKNVIYNGSLSINGSDTNIYNYDNFIKLLKVIENN